MSPPQRTGKRTLRTLLPIAALIVMAVIVGTTWLVYAATHPPSRAYLLTPDTFRALSDRGLQATDERWANRDGTEARGWLLRGAEGAPAVIMLHPFGGDRSWLLNLGVKLNETTNYTVLWIDARGHGPEPLTGATTFGGREAQDVHDAIRFLHTLQTPQAQPLVGGDIGLFGVELGAYAALLAAGDEPRIKALALDSVPHAADDLLHAAVRERTGINSELLALVAQGGARLYFVGNYTNTTACEAASELTNGHVLLLSGASAGDLQASTAQLAKCFTPETEPEVATDLPLTGLQIAFATGLQGDEYDRRVIDFFSRALSP